MSLGLGVVLPNGAILASDTRQRNVFEPPNYEDVPGKLERLTDQLWAVRIGITVVTKVALDRVREDLTQDLGPREVSDLVRDATRLAWEEFARKFNLDQDSELAAIVLVGGLAQGHAFLCGAYQTCYRGQGVPRFILLEPFNFAVFGGKATGGHYNTLENGLKAIKGCPADPVPSVLELIRAVMEEAAQSDPDVGGEIEYVVVRQGSVVELDSLGVIKNAKPINSR